MFLIPIIYDRRVGIVFSGTKIAWLRAFVIIALSVWSIKLLITKKHTFIRTSLDWPILTFLFTTTIAALSSIHVFVSIAGFYGRFEGLTTWYVLGLLFFIVTNFINTHEKIKRIIINAVLGGVVMAVYGIIQRQEIDPYAWGGVITWQRIIGTIGQPNFLAAYVIMAFFLALILLFEKKDYSSKINWSEQLLPLGCFFFIQALYVTMIYSIYSLEGGDIFLWYSGFGLMTAAAILFSFNYKKLHPLVFNMILGFVLILLYVCLLYTQSRGGYMGIFTGGVLFALLAGRKLIFDNWKVVSSLGAVLLLISVFTMTKAEYSPVQRFTDEVKTKAEKLESGKVNSRLELGGAAGSRGETWTSAFNIISDYPLFGVGTEVLKMVFPRYETELFRFKEAFHVKQDRSHNETLDVPVTKGMISFFVYLWIMFVIFRKVSLLRKNISDQQRLMIAGILAAILAYIIQNQFSFGVIAITLLFWIAWGMLMVATETVDKGSEDAPISLSTKEIPYIPIALVILVASGSIYVSFLSFRGDLLFKSGKNFLEQRMFPQAADEFKKSLVVYPFEGTTISHLAIAYLNAGDGEKAEKVLLHGTKIDPYNADNFYMLSRLYLSQYDRGDKNIMPKVVMNVEISLKLDPYYAESYDTKGAIFEREGKIKEAYLMYVKAFQVNPNLPGPIEKITFLSKQLGETNKAKAMFQKTYDEFPNNLEVFKALGRM